MSDWKKSGWFAEFVTKMREAVGAIDGDMGDEEQRLYLVEYCATISRAAVTLAR